VHYVSLSTGNVLDMYKAIGWEFGIAVERSRSSALIIKFQAVCIVRHQLPGLPRNGSLYP